MEQVSLDLNVKGDFPIFQHRPDLVYLDNAATVQKPRDVIETEARFYKEDYTNVHRGTYELAYRATELFEGTRQLIAQFIGAASPAEVIFTSNATAALNLAAHVTGRRLEPGDEVLVSVAGHHSNILPWYQIAKARGAKVVWLEVDPSRQFPLAQLREKLSRRTKVVAVEQVANVLGYVAPMAEVAAAAHQVGAQVVMDAAQSGGRIPIDVQSCDADFVAFSGHKMYGPTGTGWLYARKELVAEAEPLIVGGGTIKEVARERVEWQDSPFRFEAGTPHIAGVVGLGAALKYLQGLGMDQVWEHDRALAAYALEKLSEVEGLTLYGPAELQARAAVFAFTLSAGGRVLHSHDVAHVTDSHQVAVRGGHHCAQPLMAALGVSDVIRASFAVYNTAQDIDRLVEALKEAHNFFGKK